MQDVLTFLPKIFGRTIRKIIMNKSYRNTIEIAEYAAKFTGKRIWNIWSVMANQ